MTSTGTPGGSDRDAESPGPSDQQAEAAAPPLASDGGDKGIEDDGTARDSLRRDDVTGRWAQWMDRSIEVAEANAEPKEPALRRKLDDWRMMRDENRLARQERARIRREQRDIAHGSAAVEREIMRERLATQIAEARTSLSSLRGRGVASIGRVLFERRWFRVSAVVMLAVVCGLGGATAMRIKTRRYLTAVIVAVNGRPITREQLLDELSREHGDSTLERMVQREMRRQFVVERGAVPSDREVDARFRFESKAPDFWQKVTQAGKSEAEYRAALRRVMADIKLVTRGVTVTEPEMQAFYRRHADPSNMRSLFYSPEQYVVAVIVTATEADAMAAKAGVDAGRRWGDVARQYSVDASAAQGGLVPPIDRGRSLFARLTGLDEIAARLRSGEQVGPVHKGGYWWLVRCLGRRPAFTKKYDVVKEDVRMYAMLEKGEALNKARLDKEYSEFTKKAQVQRFGSL